MPQLAEPTTSQAQREVIDDIASEIGIGLRVAQFDFPVYITLPSSGCSIATMACPLDPTDTEWSKAKAIVCRIIAERLGDIRLRGRPLHCAIANGIIAATDVTADAESEE